MHHVPERMRIKGKAEPFLEANWTGFFYVKKAAFISFLAHLLLFMIYDSGC
jgi:hypothetical protein